MAGTSVLTFDESEKRSVTTLEKKNGTRTHLHGTRLRVRVGGDDGVDESTDGRSEVRKESRNAGVGIFHVKEESGDVRMGIGWWNGDSWHQKSRVLVN